MAQAEVCDPIHDLEVPLLLAELPIRAFVQNCQSVIAHDGEDSIVIMVP